MKRLLLLTCEHGGARVPRQYQALFHGRAAQRALRSHRGCDHGALGLARSLSHALEAPLYWSTVTRLLVDLNRSIGHPDLFSEFSKALSPSERASLLARYYYPHRKRVENWIARRVRPGCQVVHIGVHSFTPRVGEKRRTADLGLLYDPARPVERQLCRRWKDALRSIDPRLRVRRNYPFLGSADGLVTHLRAMFGPRQYVGLELEANQALLSTPQGKRRAARSVIASLPFGR